MEEKRKKTIKRSVETAHQLMQVLESLSQSTKGSIQYAKGIAKTSKSVNDKIQSIVEELRDKHVRDKDTDRYFNLAAQLSQVDENKLKEGDLKELDKLKDEKKELEATNSGLTEAYEEWMKASEKTLKKEISIQVYCIKESEMPNEVSPATMKHLYENDLIMEDL